MKKRIAFPLLSLVGLVVFYACERDDVCVDRITPRLFVQFYKSPDHKAEEPATLTLRNLTITTLGKGEKGKGEKWNALYSNITADGVYLPLRIDADISKFTISIDEKRTDVLTIRYQRKNQFVSKACGLRTIYINLRETHTTDSIKSITINREDILLEDEDKPGLSIYF